MEGSPPTSRRAPPPLLRNVRFPLTKRPSSAAKHFRFRLGVPEDAAELAALHTAVADDLTGRYGKGPWSSHTSEKGVLYAMRQSKVLVATEGAAIVATLRLAKKNLGQSIPVTSPSVRGPCIFWRWPLHRRGNGRELAEDASNRPSASRGRGRRMPFASTPMTPTREAGPFIGAAVFSKGAVSPIARRRSSTTNF
jgi:hypothetical protein